MLKLSINASDSRIGKSGFGNFETDQDEQTSYLIFEVASYWYAASLLQIREVRRMPALTRIAHCPSYIKGVASVRGEIIPVIDLQYRLSEVGSEFQATSPLILICEAQGRWVGLSVGAVHEVIALTPDAIQAIPKTTTSIDLKYLKGMAQHNDQVLLIVDLERVLLPEELQALEAGMDTKLESTMPA
jgi:purine-binding chemotaxis protein CheW